MRLVRLPFRVAEAQEVAVEPIPRAELGLRGAELRALSGIGLENEQTPTVWGPRIMYPKLLSQNCGKWKLGLPPAVQTNWAALRSLTLSG